MENVENQLIHSYPFNKKNLILLLELLKGNKSSFTYYELTHWCWDFWSNWRSNNNNLFESTEEGVIETIIEITNEYIKFRSIEKSDYSEVQVNKWLKKLSLQ